MMSKVGDEFEEPPPQLNENSNPIVVEVGSKSGTSKTPTLEDLIKKLEKLKAENKKLKA
jgi:vacuolar-type H+-ATPase subunit F/Vma7